MNCDTLKRDCFTVSFFFFLGTRAKRNFYALEKGRRRSCRGRFEETEKILTNGGREGESLVKSETGAEKLLTERWQGGRNVSKIRDLGLESTNGTVAGRKNR